VALTLFLKIDGITGESQDQHHPREIELGAFSYSVDLKTAVGGPFGGSAGVGKSILSEVQFEAASSVASPPLFLACAQGKHIPTAVLTAVKAGTGADYYTVTFTDVEITGYEQSGDAEGLRDNVTFSYTAIRIELRPQDATGKLGLPVVADWDSKRQST
jgi:type VI secretion system secreted protein Hcp